MFNKILAHEIEGNSIKIFKRLIKFYNLLTGKQVHGTQASNLDQNQKLFTTFDMQAGDEKGIQARIINLVTESEEGILVEDHIRMLVIYHDLNGNIYNFILK